MREAAKVAGLDESTIRRYKRDPAFVGEYKRCCAEMLETATDKAKAAMPPAIDRLRGIVEDDQQQAQQQIAAARAVLEYGLRLVESNDFETRLRALEERTQDL